MKYVLVIGDGMADNPLSQLGGKTPLAYAPTPAMDALAAKGQVGQVVNCPAGLPAGSDTAILSIMGCDPNKYYTGRAPLEAAAAGIRLAPGDGAYRCNMVAYEDGEMPFEEKRILSHSAGSIEGEQSDALLAALFQDPDFKAAADRAGVVIHPASSFRHMTVQTGADLNGIVLIPPHDHLGEQIGPLLPTGCPNAAVLRGLMELAHNVLDQHPINQERRAQGKLPANGIWFWAEGTAVALPSFPEQFGRTGGMVSAVPLCHGIAALTGLDAVHVKGATGELETNYEGKVAAVLDLLKQHDFAAIHIEAPDECTHNGDLEGKLQAIAWLDSRVIAPLVAGLESAGEDFRMLILSDHKTLTETRGHDAEPVPFLLYDSTRDTGLSLPYCEQSGLAGTHYDNGAYVNMRMLFDLPL